MYNKTSTWTDCFSKRKFRVHTKILEAHPREDYKIWLKFDDNSAGEVGLSNLAGKGVFPFWNNYDNFKKVVIENSRWLSWPNEIDLDADTLYLKLTGKKPQELFPALRVSAHSSE